MSDARRSLRLFRQGGVYVGALFLVRGGNFLLLPVYTALLTTDEYGTVGLVQKLVDLLVLLAVAGQGQALMRLGVDRERRSLGVQRLLSSQLGFVILTAAILAPITALCWPWLAIAVGGNPLSPVGLAGLVGVVGAAVFRLELSALQLSGQAERHTILIVLRWFAVVVGFGLLVGVFHLQATGLLLATSISFTLLAVVGFFYMPKGTALRLEPSILKPSLAFGIPLIPHAAAGALLAATDRAVVAHYGGLGEAGIYVLAANLSGAVVMVSMGMQGAYLPFFLRQDRDRSGRGWGGVPRIALTIHGLVALAAAAVGLGAPEIVTLFSSKPYASASLLLPVLVCAQLVRTFSVLNTPVSMTEIGTARWLVAVSLPAAAVNLALNLIWVPRFGAVGAAWATLVAFTLLSLLSEVLARRARIVPFLRGREGAVLLTVVAALAAGHGRELPIRFALGLGVLTVLWFLVGRDGFDAWKRFRAGAEAE